MFGRAGGISLSTAAVTAASGTNNYNFSHHHRGEETTTILKRGKKQQGIFTQIPNEIIFDQILCYFEYQWILQTARLICKCWNDHHKTIKTNQFKITYNGNIEKIILMMNEHSDELHQITELTVKETNDSKVELERQFFSKLINLQNLNLWPKDCDISIIKDFVRLTNLKRIHLRYSEHFEEFIHCPSKIKSISVFHYPNYVISDFDYSNLNWPLEEFRFDKSTSNSIMSLLKNEIMTKNLNKLTLSYSKLDETVMKEISTLSKLSVLDLTHAKCGDVGAQYISKLENLENVILYNNSINGSGLSNFRNLSNITTLNLEFNSIDNEGANHLSSVTSLKYLYLTNNKISDEGLKNYWKLSNLLELDLSYNQIGSIGANYISQITNITSLNLSDNLIGEEGLKNFGNLLNLKLLYLENNKIGNGFQYLSNCTQISTLNVSKNNISEESVMKYCENKMKPLVKQVYISKNPIGNSGFASLVKLPELTTIQANNCGISDKGIFKMLEIIRYKKSITLDLEQNYVTNKSLKKMIESKYINNTQYLKISNTNSELDPNYLKILSEKLDLEYSCINKTQPKTKAEDNRNRCIIQ